MTQTFLMHLALSAKGYPNYVLLFLFFVWGVACFVERKKSKCDTQTFIWTGLFLWTQSLLQLLFILNRETRLEDTFGLCAIILTAMIVAVLCGGFTVWSAISSLKNTSSRVIGLFIGAYTALILLVFIPFTFSKMVSLSSVQELDPDQLEKQDVYHLDKYRLSVEDPGAEWSRYDPLAIGTYDNAALVFLTSEGASLVMNCLQTPQGHQVTSETIAKATLDQMKSNNAKVSVVRNQKAVHGGVQGIRLCYSLDHGYKAAFFDSWIAVDGNLAYAVVATDESGRKDLVKQSLDAFLDKIQIHDIKGVQSTGAVAEVLGSLPSTLTAQDLYSAQYGINFESLDRSWNLWPKGKELYPTSEMAFTTVNEQYLVISPVYLPSKKLPTEAMFQSLLDLHGIPVYKAYRDKPVKSEIGSAFRYEQTFWMKGSRDAHRIYGRVVWNNQMGWIIHAEGMAVSTDTQEFLKTSVKQASLIQPGGAVDFQALSLREKQRQAMFFSGVGQYYDEIESSHEALVAYQAALSWDMADEYYLLKVLAKCIELELYEDALKTLELTGDLHRLSNRVQGEKGFLLEMSGQELEALERYTYAFDNWLHHDEYFERYLRLLVQDDQKKEAESRARQYLKHSGSREVRLVLAELLEETGAFEEAVSLLTIIETESIEYDPEIRMALARVYLRAGKYRDSYRILGELITKGHGTDDVFKLKEDADQYQDWIKKANETFEYAVSGVSVRPGMSDEGESASVTSDHFRGKEIVPVKITHLVYPEEMDVSTRSSLYRIPLWLKAIVHRPDEEYRETTRINYEILNREGVKALSPLRIRYYPDFEDLSIGVVHFYNDKKQDIGAVDRRKITSHTINDASNGLRQDEVLIPLPKLEENTFIELIYTIKRKVKPESLPVVTVEPDRSVPIGRVALLVDTASLPVSFSSQVEVNTETEVGIHRYTIDNVLPIYKEPFQGGSDDDYPLMIAADGSTNWDLISKQYLLKNPVFSEGDARLYEVAHDLTKECYSVQSKVEKLAVAVRDELAFNGEAFGKYYQTPNDLGDIMQIKAGSALDHGTLFVRLADCVGINAQLVFAHTDHDPIKSVYSMGQFNTVLVRVEEGRQVRFLDLTQKDCAVSLSVPLGFAGKEVYLLDPENPRFIEMPSYTKDENSLGCERTVVYNKGGSVAVGEQWRCFGYSKDSTEKQLLEVGLAEDGSEFFQFFRRQVPTVNHLKITELAGVGLPEKPLEIKFDYDVLDVVNKHPGRWIGAPPGSLEGVLLHVENLPPRKLPFEIELPIHFSAKVVCHFPEGMKLSGGDLIPLNRKSPYVDWSVDYIKKEDSLEIQFDFQRHAGIFRAKEYPMYRQSVEEAFNSLQPNVLLVTE